LQIPKTVLRSRINRRDKTVGCIDRIWDPVADTQIIVLFDQPCPNSGFVISLTAWPREVTSWCHFTNSRPADSSSPFLIASVPSRWAFFRLPRLLWVKVGPTVNSVRRSEVGAEPDL
jgi:hypothetical protein